MMNPPREIPVTCPGVALGRYALVSTRIYTARGGGRYDYKLVDVVSGRTLGGSPGGTRRLIQIRFGPATLVSAPPYGVGEA